MQLKRILICFMVFLFTVPGAIWSSEESPPYELVLKDGPFEVRNYPEMIVASTVSEGNDNSLFRTLAGYIFGGNESEKRIPMTAPVFMSDKKGKSSMMFFMPSKYTLKSLPKPNDPMVKLKTFQLGKVAVLRYSGLNPKSKRLKKLGELQKWAKKKGIQVTGQDSLAMGYDSPWTFPWNRRNEVLIFVNNAVKGL